MLKLMNVISVNFENPISRAVYTDLGSSPNLLKAFEGWLTNNKENIRSIDISVFLFNNRKLYDVFLNLANHGVEVNVYSIPLEGYDINEAEIISSELGNSLGKHSKLDLAQDVYNEFHKRPHPNMKLFIFPHTYVRSKNLFKFSRGSLPYSLHIKHFVATMKNGEMVSGLSSSNLAVRDESKIEMAIVVKLSPSEAYSTKDFYIGLRENSIPISEFDLNKKYYIKMRTQPPKSRAMYFAPFYFDSPVDFEENLKTMVGNAHSRIIICGQHVCAYDYTIPQKYTNSRSKNRTGKSEGFLTSVLSKIKDGIDVQILSQTYCDQRGTHNCRAPQNKSAFVNFVEAARRSGCTYYVNEKIHSKFIIIDDIIIITTANFTPTQFIYLPNVDIPEYDYSGIHSEVGTYFVISSKELADKMVEHYETLLNDVNTKQMFSKGKYKF